MSSSRSARCLTAVLVLLAAACGSTTTESTSPSAPTGCQVSVSPPAAAPAAGGALPVQLMTTRDCLWSARSEAEWLTPDPASGQGESTFTVSVAPNPQGRTRTGALVINDKTLQIVQEATPCRFDLEPRQISMPHQGGRARVQITSLEACTWTATSPQRWVRVLSGGRGEWNGVIELAVDGNTGAARTAQVQAAGQTVTVRQEAGPDNRTECRFSFNVGSANFSAAGGDGTVQLHTLPGCAWGAVSTQPWIIVTSGSNASETGTITYTVEPNPTSGRREGAILAGGRQHIVRQSAP